MQARVEVEQVILRRRRVVALAGAHEGDDGDSRGSGGVELKQAPRAEEHLLGLEEHDHVRVEDVPNEIAEVTKVVRVCALRESGRAHTSLVCSRRARDEERGVGAALAEENFGAEH